MSVETKLAALESKVERLTRLVNIMGGNPKQLTSIKRDWIEGYLHSSGWSRQGIHGSAFWEPPTDVAYRYKDYLDLDRIDDRDPWAVRQVLFEVATMEQRGLLDVLGSIINAAPLTEQLGIVDKGLV